MDDSPTMMEADDIYLRLKASNDSQTFIGVWQNFSISGH